MSSLQVVAAGFAQLEAAISLSASVADSLSQGEDIIDFFAAGPDLYVFRTGQRIGQFENLLELLACVEHCPIFVEPLDKIIDIRRYQVMGCGNLPPEAKPMTR